MQTPPKKRRILSTREAAVFARLYAAACCSAAETSELPGLLPGEAERIDEAMLTLAGRLHPGEESTTSTADILNVILARRTV